MLSWLLPYLNMQISPNRVVFGFTSVLGWQIFCKAISGTSQCRFSPNVCSSSAVAYFYIDSKGRRFLLITSLAAMVPLLLATGFSFKSHLSVRAGLVSTFLILYTLAYSPGGGVVPFLYTSEIFPQVLRGKHNL